MQLGALQIGSLQLGLLQLGPLQLGQMQLGLLQLGALQIGPKSQLNASAKMRVYDVADLLFVVPSFREVPDLDLGSIVQGGGGSTQTEIEVEDPECPFGARGVGDQEARSGPAGSREMGRDGIPAVVTPGGEHLGAGDPDSS